MTNAGGIGGFEKPIYTGSVKDLYGPIELDGKSAVIFQYSDAYSVFDWGRMPDALEEKGAALAVLAAALFEKLERAECWREWMGAPEAEALLEANESNGFGAELPALGKELERTGLRTHFLGVLDGPAENGETKPKPLERVNGAVSRIVVRQVSVVRPQEARILGRSVLDYGRTRLAPLPRLIPLEVVFRFGCPPGSSLLERVGKKPQYLSNLGFPGFTVYPGVRWDFPVLELFTKLESSDRLLRMSEALAISGISGEKLQEMLLRTAWVATWLKSVCAKAGLELADGKLEWAVDENGELLLVDAIGPDELRLLRGRTQLSKEFLRTFYRGTPWYEAISEAKKKAAETGTADWKSLVRISPSPLPPKKRELARHLYLALANELSGRRWFADAWSLDRVAEGIAADTKG